MISKVVGKIVLGILFFFFVLVCVFGWPSVRTTVKAARGEVAEALNSVKPDQMREREIRDLTRRYGEAVFEAAAKAEELEERVETAEGVVAEQERLLATQEGFLRDSRTRLEKEGRESFLINGHAVSREELSSHVIRVAAAYKSGKDLLTIKREAVQRLREAYSSAREAQQGAQQQLVTLRDEHEVLLARLDAAQQQLAIEELNVRLCEPFSGPQRELAEAMAALRKKVRSAEARVRSSSLHPTGGELPAFATPGVEADALVAIASALEDTEVAE